RVRRVDWSLTPDGEELLPVFHALMVWGARHERPARAAREGRPVQCERIHHCKLWRDFGKVCSIS
ncbi:MAG: hypothetical protein IJ829_06255, partial [Kiritimatiellae bacterium]|nr:hypothetical protein [Kiritimatiellia bacterium]